MSESTEPAHQNQPAPSASRMSNLTVRLLTAAVGIPIILWMLYLAPGWVFSAFAVLVAVVGGAELSGMTLKGARPLQIWLIFAAAAVTAVLTFSGRSDVIVSLLFGLVVIGALAVLVWPDPLERAAGRMGWLIAGPLYVGGAVAAIAMLHHLDNGGSWVVLSMMLAWGSDTGGYFAGRAFGRHKLYPKVSPKKTVEGAIGGLAAVVGFAVGMKLFAIPELSWVHAVVLALLAGAVGQAGDLCISVIKRSTGVKDSGNIIPGHGGLLDRIDALMFTAVVTFLYTHWVLELPRTLPTFGS